MVPLAANVADFLFTAEGIPAGEVQVESFSGREEISRPYQYRVTLVSRNRELDLDAPIGKPGTLRIRTAKGERPIHGIVERFEQGVVAHGYSRYDITLIPTLGLLRFTRNSRLFAAKPKLNTPQIVEKVLKDAGYPQDMLQLALQGTYAARDYTVQYQESDFDFLCRLLEEEGIFFFWEHTKDKEVWVLGDTQEAIEPLPGAGTLEFLNALGADDQHHEVFHSFRAESGLRPGKTVLRDYRFKQPGLNLEVDSTAKQFEQLQVYYYPGDYVEPELGKRLAAVRMEELVWDRKCFHGIGTVRNLRAGYKFRLAGHGRSSFDNDYLIVAVEQSGSQPQVLEEMAMASGGSGGMYQSDTLCIPWGDNDERKFRPHRLTPRPLIVGVQTAVVVGPPGEEIHCDEHGRVMVQFHWDRDGKLNDQSACWIRVSQPWGGMGQGGMFIPRVGQEVLVQFLEGDPDRPMIVGRVYNGKNPVPHGLPGGKNISTIRSSSTPGGGGFNEIKFNDSAGSEEMFIHAQFNRNEIVGNNHDTKVTVDQSLSVGSKQTTSVGANQSLSVGGDQSISVTGNRSVTTTGNETIDVKGNRTETVTGNDGVTVKANRTASIIGNRTETITGNGELNITGNNSTAVMGSGSESIMGSRTITVQGAQTHELVGAMTANCAAAITYNAAGDLALNTGANASIGAVGTLSLASTGAATLTSSAEVGIGAPTINVSGATITITAGGASIKLSGAGVEINGPSVKIGGGSVDVTGGIVKIN